MCDVSSSTVNLKCHFVWEPVRPVFFCFFWGGSPPISPLYCVLKVTFFKKGLLGVPNMKKIVLNMTVFVPNMKGLVQKYDWIFAQDD